MKACALDHGKWQIVPRYPSDKSPLESFLSEGSLAARSDADGMQISTQLSGPRLEGCKGVQGTASWRCEGNPPVGRLGSELVGMVLLEMEKHRGGASVASHEHRAVVHALRLARGSVVL